MQVLVLGVGSGGDRDQLAVEIDKSVGPKLRDREVGQRIGIARDDPREDDHIGSLEGHDAISRSNPELGIWREDRHAVKLEIDHPIGDVELFDPDMLSGLD